MTVKMESDEYSKERLAAKFGLKLQRVLPHDRFVEIIYDLPCKDVSTLKVFTRVLEDTCEELYGVGPLTIGIEFMDETLRLFRDRMQEAYERVYLVEKIADA